MSAGSTVTGFVEKVTDAEHFGNKGFYKREVWLRFGGEYPQVVNVEFHKEHCRELVDELEIGALARIDYELRGREWTNPQTGVTKCFVSLVGMDVTPLKKPDAPPAVTETVDGVDDVSGGEKQDEIPF